MSACQETAIEYQEKMEPFAEKAERDAALIFKALEISIPKVYELVPKEGVRNKFIRLVFKLIEE